MDHALIARRVDALVQKYLGDILDTLTPDEAEARPPSDDLIPAEPSSRPEPAPQLAQPPEKELVIDEGGPARKLNPKPRKKRQRTKKSMVLRLLMQIPSAPPMPEPNVNAGPKRRIPYSAYSGQQIKTRSGKDIGHFRHRRRG